MYDQLIFQMVFTLGLTAIGIIPVLMHRTRRFRRELKRYRLWRLSEIPDGRYGRIVGRAHPIGEALIAPMTGRRCVYYDIKVEAKGIAPTPTKMTVIAAESRAAPFLLVDATGRAIIDPAGADMLVSFNARSDFGNQIYEVTPAHIELFARHGRTVTGGVYGTELRFREAVILVEDMITVLGVATREPDPDPVPSSGRVGPQSRVRFANAPRRLMITDEWSPDEKPD